MGKQINKLCNCTITYQELLFGCNISKSTYLHPSLFRFTKHYDISFTLKLIPAFLKTVAAKQDVDLNPLDLEHDKRQQHPVNVWKMSCI